ncbi:MAG: 50S ribosomal protein L10, partial [Nanoarchaeota archaeon]|nr:50S ribosomal protein L10 [Nanoarchaeota archaeon]
MPVQAHVADYKKRIVDTFVKLIKEYPIVGAVNMEGMPTPQLQKMREEIRKKNIVLLMTKRRLLKIAIENAKSDKKGIEEIGKYLNGMPALIFSKENPFKLSKLLSSSKSKAPAKGGQTAPNDIVVKAGGTSFAPGPIIGELGALGIKSGVEGGKVAIKEDCVVCKEGGKISAKLAEILTRLGIEPMEVGLDLVAVYEDGLIFKKDVLAIDEKEFIDK